MADPTWPTDPPPPNAFSGDKTPLLRHQHLYFEVPDPNDLDDDGKVLAGGTLLVSGIDPSLPVGAILVYLYDAAKPWSRTVDPTVVAIASAGLDGVPTTLQITQTTPRDFLRPIAIESVQAWRDWLAAWWDPAHGGTGSAGDGNSQQNKS